MSPASLLALLRNRSRGHHAYVRYLPLIESGSTWLQRLADALPIRRATQMAEGLQESNLWLGDGGMRSALHLDYMDNLLLQLQGEKQLLLLPPSAHAAAGYRLRSERRYVFDESTEDFSGDEATGWPRVANHATLEVFAAGAEAEAAAVSPGLAASALRCTLRAGEALFIPALWSHAVASSAAEAGAEAPAGSAEGLNAAANLW